MGEPRAKSFEYEVGVGVAGALSVDGSTVSFPQGWTADHLLLAALVRCSIESLRYHARRAGHELTASGSAHGRVARRESDGRYAFVEIGCRIEGELSPAADETAELTAMAERDCFIAASLAIKPSYEWQLGSV